MFSLFIVYLPKISHSIGVLYLNINVYTFWITVRVLTPPPYIVLFIELAVSRTASLLDMQT